MHYLAKILLWGALCVGAAGCGTTEGYLYVPPPTPEPMGIQFWWGTDPTCAPGCPPGSPRGW
ncbi:MAG: hypothetical protein K6T55_11945 [Syntrophobacterales bacterium]|nr:hypothetical protein [Syntrophobacterales bacterium]